MRIRLLRALVAAAAALLMLDIAMFVFRDRIVAFAVNASAGCWPWSPMDIPYRDGMTLCPGQTAHATIIIQIAPDDAGRRI